MNIKKFIAPTSREALRAARAALGDHAMVLSNRDVTGGTELLVMASDAMDALMSPSALASSSPSPSPSSSPFFTASPTAAVSEKSFGLQEELRTMRGLLETQLATLAWNGRQPESRARVLRKLLNAGFSTGLSRYIAEHLPAHAMDSDTASDGWLADILQRNLAVMDSDHQLLEQGGVFALVGPTGVGKTTSTAKLAARCVARHGAARVGLVTTDGYRIGAFEQLRIYGRLLGVMVHSVRDAADLSVALDELRNKHIVLIDTAGASQRDQMVVEQIAMLTAQPGRVKRLLCLNTGATVDTLDEVARAYRGDGLTGCLLTKIDEAARIGGALDVAIRHRLPVSFSTDGQRVPEDLHLADRAMLIAKALSEPADAKVSGVFAYTNHELPLAAASSVAAMHDPRLRELQLG